jgi:hypothetical protein
VRWCAATGVAEQQRDELTERPGVIDEIARSVRLGGSVKGAARRAMTPALAIRFTSRWICLTAALSAG